MNINDRELWALIHGMIFGVIYLLAFGVKGGKTSSEGTFRRRRDSNRAGLRREHHDNESCHAGIVNAELAFAAQGLDEDVQCCSSVCIPSSRS